MLPINSSREKDGSTLTSFRTPSPTLITSLGSLSSAVGTHNVPSSCFTFKLHGLTETFVVGSIKLDPRDSVYVWLLTGIRKSSKPVDAPLPADRLWHLLEKAFDNDYQVTVSGWVEDGSRTLHVTGVEVMKQLRLGGGGGGSGGGADGGEEPTPQ